MTANTRGCFSEFIGQRVVGTLLGALPVNRKDIAAGTKTLVFEDGRGLTIAGNGSYWIDNADEVRRAVDDLQGTGYEQVIPAAKLREHIERLTRFEDEFAEGVDSKWRDGYVAALKDLAILAKLDEHTIQPTGTTDGPASPREGST